MQISRIVCGRHTRNGCSISMRRNRKRRGGARHRIMAPEPSEVSRRHARTVALELRRRSAAGHFVFTTVVLVAAFRISGCCCNKLFLLEVCCCSAPSFAYIGVTPGLFRITYYSFLQVLSGTVPGRPIESANCSSELGLYCANVGRRLKVLMRCCDCGIPPRSHRRSLLYC